jgi:hypothetical protein
MSIIEPYGDGSSDVNLANGVPTAITLSNFKNVDVDGAFSSFVSGSIGDYYYFSNVALSWFVLIDATGSGSGGGQPPPPPPAPNALTFTVEPVIVAAGATSVTVPVKITNVNHEAWWAFALSYDHSLLTLAAQPISVTSPGTVTAANLSGNFTNVVTVPSLTTFNTEATDSVKTDMFRVSANSGDLGSSNIELRIYFTIADGVSGEIPIAIGSIAEYTVGSNTDYACRALANSDWGTTAKNLTAADLETVVHTNGSVFVGVTPPTYDRVYGYGGTITYNGTGNVVSANLPGYVIDEIFVDGVSLANVRNQSTYTVSGTPAREIAAYFAYTLSFNNPSNGTLSVSREGASFTSGGIVRGGDVITITATPAQGYEIDEFELVGLHDNGDDTYTVYGTVAPSIHVTYKLITNSGTVDAVYGYGGTITGTPGAYVVSSNRTGYVIDKLVVDGAVVTAAHGQATYSANVTPTRSIVAYFAYTLSFNTPDNGTLSVVRAGTSLTSGTIVRGGDIITINASPAQGYVLDAFDLVGLHDNGDGTYTVYGKDAPSINVTFKPTTVIATEYDISTSVSGGNGTFTFLVNGVAATKAHAGDTIKLNPQPVSDYYKIKSIKYTDGTGEHDYGSPSLEFTMPSSNVAFTVEFEAKEILVKIDDPMPHGTVVISNGVGALNDVVTLTIVPEQGYRLAPGTFNIYRDSNGIPMLGSGTSSFVTQQNELVYILQVPYAVTVKAEFTEALPGIHDVVFSANSPVGAKVNGTGDLVSYVSGVANNGSVSFTLEPLSGYAVESVTADGGILAQSGDTYTLSGITGHTVVFIETKDLWQAATRMIYTADELIAFRNEVNAGNDFSGELVRLGANISLAGKGWTTGIGSFDDYPAIPFSGTFDGDGYTITLAGKGLFGYTLGAVVKNVITNGTATSSAIAEMAYGSAIINCKNTATVNGGSGIANDARADMGGKQLAEPYVGIFRCENRANVDTAIGGGIGGMAQRIIQSANTGNNNITGYIQSGSDVTAFGSVVGPCLPGKIIDRSYNTGSVTGNFNYAYGISGVTITNSYSTGDVISSSNLGNNAFNPDRYNGIAGYLIVRNSYVSGTRSANDVVQAKILNAFYMRPYGVPPTLYGTMYDVYDVANGAVTATDLGAAFVDVSGSPKLLWENAPAKQYRVEFTHTVIIGGVSGTSFELSAGTYTYTYGGADSTFNLLSDNKQIALSSTITFGLPPGASVTVTGQTPNANGSYTLTNGEYTYTVTQPGKAPLTATFEVAGEDRVIVVSELANAISVEFDIESGVTLAVRDADDVVVSPLSEIISQNGKTLTYSFAEKADYTYTAEKTGFVGISKNFKVTSATDRIIIRLDTANATVTFNTTPTDVAATVEVKDADGAVVISDGTKVYKLSANKTYSYTVSAETYTDANGTFLAKNPLSVPVTLVQNKVNVTFNVSPSAATVVVKQGSTVIKPSSGKIYSLTEGDSYTYTVTATNYDSVSGEFTADITETISVPPLTHTKAAVKFTIPEGAEISITGNNGEAYGTLSGGVYTFNLDIEETYLYSVTKSGYTSKSDVFTVPRTGKTFSPIELPRTGTSTGTDSEPAGTVHITGDYEIKTKGTYIIDSGVNYATILVSTPDEVIILGTGTSGGDKHKELEIKYTVNSGNLTIGDLYVNNGDGATSSGETGVGKHIVDFLGGSNSLTISSLSLFDHDGYIQSAGIHVPSGSSLTMSAPGTLYMYKESQGAGIGGDSYEACGEFTFTGGKLYIKGNKTGALIGGDAGATGVVKSGSGSTNGTITFSGGEIVLIAKAQGAAIGSSHLGTCAGDVYITGSANVTVISDFNAGVGKGGNAPANAENGTLIISGGATFTPIRTANSYYAIRDNAERAMNGNSNTAYIDGGLILAIVNGGMHLFTYETNAVTGTIAKYTESTLSTMANFGSQDTKTFYEYLPAGENTRTLNGKQYTVTWNGETFDVTEYKAPPEVPAGGGSATEAVIPDLAGSTTIEAPAATVTTSASGAVTVTTIVEVAEVAKSVAEAVKIVEAAKAEGKADAIAEVKIVVKTEEHTKGATAEGSITVEAVKVITEAKALVLTVESDDATITLDRATLEGIAEGKADSDVVIISATTLEAPKAETAEQSDAPKEAKETLNEAQKEAVGENTVIDLTVTVGGKAVHDFKGEVTVASPYTPPETTVEEDYDLLTVYYVDDGGKIQEIKGAYFDPKTKQIVFKTNHFSKFMVAEWINPFSDIAKGEWYYKSVRYGVSNDLLGGIDGKFLPRTNSSRATMIVLLAKLAGIDGGVNWYDKAIDWGKSAGITDGTNPTGNITREQLFQLLYNYSGAEAVEADFSKYTDADKIHDWALPGMNWAIATGLATGRTDTTLNATEPITRSEVVTFLQKFLTMAK